MTLAFEEWHSTFLAELSDIGALYHDDSVAVNPYEISSEMIKQFETDLPKLALLARKVALKYFHENPSYAREDYRSIIALYENKPRWPSIWRPDGMIVKGQLKLFELNIDSGIGGIWEVDLLQSYLKNNPLLAKYDEKKFLSPRNGFLDFLKDVAQTINIGSAPHLALIGYADYEQLYLDQCHDMCKWITQQTPFKAFYLTAEMLRKKGSYMTDGVRDYHVIYRDGSLVHPVHKTKPVLEMIGMAKETNTVVLSDPVDLAIEQKGILPLFFKAQKENNFLEDEEIKLIDSYIPWTHYIEQIETNYKGKSIAMQELLNNHKNEFVIKKCHSHAGEHVFIGSEIHLSYWQDLVKTALSQKNQWVVQENLFSDAYPFIYNIRKKGLIAKKQRFTFSPFLFGKHYGGALIRIEQNPDKRVLGLPYNSSMGSAGVVIV